LTFSSVGVTLFGTDYLGFTELIKSIIQCFQLMNGFVGIDKTSKNKNLATSIIFYIALLVING